MMAWGAEWTRRHRAGFRRYWRWKSRNPGGRPPIDVNLRALTRRISTENVLWGAPRIQRELLKRGFSVAGFRPYLLRSPTVARQCNNDFQFIGR